MARIPKKVGCMVDQADPRSPGKRTAPGAEFSAGIDPRVRPAALPGLLDFVFFVLFVSGFSLCRPGAVSVCEKLRIRGSLF